ncbi:hypothetical protein FRC10_003263, partial [Ceratobasidium sp. 414]
MSPMLTDWAPTAKPKIEIKAEAETAVVSEINTRNGSVFGVFGRFISADPIIIFETPAKPTLSALQPTDPN